MRRMERVAVEVCGFSWPLLDPNEEDRAAGRTHECARGVEHPGGHRCRCGEVALALDEPGD